LDHRKYHFDRILNALESDDAMQAYSSVIEGNAQRIARRACAEAGWSPFFDRFSETIALAPKNDDPAEDYQNRIRTALAAFAYSEGEHLMKVVARAGGPEAVARAFAAPPAESVLILEPGWYLDPSSRPALGFDLKQALLNYGAQWDKEYWSQMQTPVLLPTLQASLGLLPDEEVSQVLEHLRQCQALILQEKQSAPAQSSIMAVLYELGSATAATKLVVLESDLMHLKDEQLTGQSVKVTEAHYAAFVADPIHGFIASKLVEVGFAVLEVTTLVAIRGPLVVELNFINIENERADLIEAAARLLEPRTASESDPVPEELPEPADTEEEDQ
jgi:hypothetical protein